MAMLEIPVNMLLI